MTELLTTRSYFVQRVAINCNSLYKNSYALQSTALCDTC